MKRDRLLAGVADDMVVLTGHTVTAISCMGTLFRAVDRFGLEFESEQLTILGMGSVGSAFLGCPSCRAAATDWERISCGQQRSLCRRGIEAGATALGPLSA